MKHPSFPLVSRPFSLQCQTFVWASVLFAAFFVVVWKGRTLLGEYCVPASPSHSAPIGYKDFPRPILGLENLHLRPGFFELQLPFGAAIGSLYPPLFECFPRLSHCSTWVIFMPLSLNPVPLMFAIGMKAYIIPTLFVFWPSPLNLVPPVILPSPQCPFAPVVLSRFCVICKWILGFLF